MRGLLVNWDRLNNFITLRCVSINKHYFKSDRKRRKKFNFFDHNQISWKYKNWGKCWPFIFIYMFLYFYFDIATMNLISIPQTILQLRYITRNLTYIGFPNKNLKFCLLVWLLCTPQPRGFGACGADYLQNFNLFWYEKLFKKM